MPVPEEGVPTTRRELRERERSLAAATPRRAARRTGRPDTGPRTPASRAGFGKRLAQLGVMLVAGALAFEMTLPAFAGEAGHVGTSAQPVAASAQSVDIDPTLVSLAERDTWGVTSWAEMLKLRYGTRDFSYTVGTGPVRWPFPAPVPISSGFGDRAAPCRACSSVHLGVDFTPGNGAAIFAIADGVVVEHVDGSGGLGNNVMIQHEIDGQTVYSQYGHMQHGSSPLQVGDQVRVGDFVGLVGSTGVATGPHLHLNILIGTVTNHVDPFAFLKRYAS